MPVEGMSRGLNAIKAGMKEMNRRSLKRKAERTGDTQVGYGPEGQVVPSEARLRQKRLALARQRHLANRDKQMSNPHTR